MQANKRSAHRLTLAHPPCAFKPRTRAPKIHSLRPLIAIRSLGNAKKPERLSPTDADKADIQAALQTLRAKLPFLIGLSPQQRKKLLKLGDGSVAFVERALAAAQAHPQVLPGHFNLAEFARDRELWNTLRALAPQFEQLYELIQDTITALGSDLMSAGIQVYGYMQSSEGMGLEEVRAQLSERFRKSPAAPAPTPTPAT